MTPTATIPRSLATAPFSMGPPAPTGGLAAAAHRSSRVACPPCSTVTSENTVSLRAPDPRNAVIMDLDIVLVSQHQHSSIYIGHVVTGPLLRRRNYRQAVHAHLYAPPGVHLQSAMLEDEFVSFKLHDGLGFDRESGSISVDPRSGSLLSPYQVVWKNRRRTVCWIPIQPCSPRVVEHRTARALGYQRRGRDENHHAANEFAPLRQTAPRLPHRTAWARIACRLSAGYWLT